MGAAPSPSVPLPLSRARDVIAWLPVSDCRGSDGPRRGVGATAGSRDGWLELAGAGAFLFWWWCNIHETGGLSA